MDRLGIESWLNNFGIKNYIINEDLSVVVDGNVNLSSKGLIDIPVMFSVVNGIDENKEKSKGKKI